MSGTEVTHIAPALLPYLEDVLVQRGFYNPGVLQLYKRDQKFGLVKRLDQALEMHVRGFNDGRVDAEIEISRDYFEHLGPNSCRPAQTELEAILEEVQIPFTPAKAPADPGYVVIPHRLTEWRKVLPMAFGSLAGVVPIALLAFHRRRQNKNSLQKT